MYEAAPDLVRMAGRIWEIASQTSHAFWLNLTGADEMIRSILYVDVVGTEREKRHAFDLHERAEDITWAYRMEGEAAVEGGTLLLRSLKQHSES